MHTSSNGSVVVMLTRGALSVVGVLRSKHRLHPFIQWSISYDIPGQKKKRSLINDDVCRDLDVPSYHVRTVELVTSDGGITS